jgi:hypothetical protein
LIERVMIRITADGVSPELIGQLTSMIELGLGLDSKKPVSGETGFWADCMGSANLVAGTRNHRQLTL